MAAATSAIVYDVCDIEKIYSKGFSYSLPEKLLRDFLNGTAFEEKKTPYTPEQVERLKADIRAIYDRILSKNPVKEKIAVMTAGAPGAGKTVLMEKDLAQQERSFAYIDPDAVCLKTMENSYLADLKQQEPQAVDDASKKQIRLAAYNEWRSGSNAATHLILANLIRDGFGFYFGTTSTSPQGFRFMDFLKKQGYTIRIIHLIAPDKVRSKSIKKRDQIFVQTTKEDIREKGKLLPQRIQDTFLKYADQIEFYYRDAVDHEAVKAANWERRADGSTTLTIVNQIAYDAMKKVHNSLCIDNQDIQWEKTVEKSG